MVSVDKIYLSKSNHANPDYVMRVRQYLQRLGYTVVEHNGGPYRAAPLSECSLMVMVGYDLNEDDLMEVGKGQYEQLEYRENYGFECESNFYFVGFDGCDTPDFYSVKASRILNKDDWTKGYGQLQLVDHGHIPSILTPGKIAGAKQGINIHLACITLF